VQQRIEKHIPLRHVFVGDVAIATLKPVVHNLRSVAFLDQRTIDAQRCAADMLNDGF
jgi:hypothetical protein